MKLITALENLKFYAYHGMYNFEQELGGEFIVNIIIEEEIDENNTLNNINNLVDYEKLFEITKEEMNNTKSFIEDVAKSIFQRISHLYFDRKIKISVKINKTNPAGKFGSGSASVQLIE